MSATNFDPEKVVVTIYKFIPKLPPPLQKKIVEYLPLLTFAGGITGLIFINTSQVLIFESIFPINSIEKVNGLLQWIFSNIFFLILIKSKTPLIHGNLFGWQMIFYVFLLQLLLFIATINTLGIFFLLAGFYLLTLIRPYYTKKY